MPTPPLELLKNSPLCRALDEKEVQSVLSIASERPFAAGEMLFTEGQPGDSLLVVLEGGVEVLKKDPHGTDHVLATLGEGAILGEMSLISGNLSARTASARAIRSGRALALPARDFQARLHDGDTAALKVVYNFAQVMSRRLLAMNEQVVAVLAESGERQKSEMARFNELLTDWSF